MPERVKEKLVEIIQNSVGGCARHWAEVIADGYKITQKCNGGKRKNELRY